MDRSTTHDQEFREDQHEGEMDREILEKRETLQQVNDDGVV